MFSSSSRDVYPRRFPTNLTPHPYPAKLALVLS